jgi:gamma-glutamylcyclotransferase (GGCT)/AIG2-like uncharacterized protein YtfP
MFRIEGQCEYCENMAVQEILHDNLIDYVNVCDDCFKKIFIDVANNGVDDFYLWASEMYGDIKAIGLCKEIYGENALARIKGNVEVKDEMITMWTYGILKYPHNIEREGGINIVENSFIRGHKMYLYNNSFPITKMTNNDKDIVYGTLFEIPLSQVLYSYDITEGYNPNRHPSENMYNRIEVDVTTPSGEIKKAQMYYANQRIFASDINKNNWIPTGNFDDRHLAKSYGKRKYRKR